MAVIPDTLGTWETPTPATGVASYDSQAVANAKMEGGKLLEQDADLVQARADRDSMLDASNRITAAHAEIQKTMFGDGENAGMLDARGADALQTPAQMQAKLQDLRARTLEGVNNPTARNALGREFNDLQDSTMAQIGTFASGQRRDFAISSATNRGDVADNQAALYHNDPKMVAAALADKTNSAMALAKLNGDDADGADRRVAQAVSTLKRKQYEAQALSGQPGSVEAATAGYQRDLADGHILMSDAVPLGTLIRRAQARNTGLTDFSDFMKGSAPGADTPASGQPVPKTAAQADTEESAIDAARVMQESKNQQFDADGNVLTSSAGAVGAAQIMPGTGPEAAQLAGLPWDPDKFQNDAVYNKALGDAYYKKQYQTFGTHPLALAAYNAGPGRVKEAIAKVGDPSKGEVSQADFMKEMPAQTQGYVKNIMSNAQAAMQPSPITIGQPAVTGAAGAAPAPQSPIDETAAHQYADKLEPKRRDAFLAHVKDFNDGVATNNDAVTKGVLDAVIGQYQNNQKQNGYSRNTWATMPPDLQARAQQAGIWDQVQKYDPVNSDPATVATLYHMDPKELKAADLKTPGIWLNLSLQDQQKWTQKQAQMGTASGYTTATDRKAMLDTAFAGAGLKVGGQSGNGDDHPEYYVRANEVLDNAIGQYWDANKRWPQSNEVQKMVDNIFIQRAMPGKYWGTNQQRLFESGTADIPDDTKAMLTLALRHRGVAPTNGALLAAYAQMQGTPALGSATSTAEQEQQAQTALMAGK